MIGITRPVSVDNVGRVMLNPTEVQSGLFLLHLHLHSGHLEATSNKYICQKKEKQQCIAVGTERMFIEPKCKALTIARLTHSP